MEFQKLKEEFQKGGGWRGGWPVASKKSSKAWEMGTRIVTVAVTCVLCGSSFVETMGASKHYVWPCHLGNTQSRYSGPLGPRSLATPPHLSNLASSSPSTFLFLLFPLATVASSPISPQVSLPLGCSVFGSFPTKAHTVPSFATFRLMPMSPSVWGLSGHLAGMLHPHPMHILFSVKRKTTGP